MSTPTIDDGGPAFPHSSQPLDGQGNPLCEEHSEWGMSLRDVFAGQMAAAIIAAGNANDQRSLTSEGGPRKLAKAAYTIADAMLAVRKEPIKP